MTDKHNTLTLGIYQHYKGNFYQVLHFAKHSETQEDLVVYRTMYGNFDVWVRPLAMFCETVTVEGVEKPRFAFVRETLTD